MSLHCFFIAARQPEPVGRNRRRRFRHRRDANGGFSIAKLVIAFGGSALRRSQRPVDVGG
jgi:hypothetical protein